MADLRVVELKKPEKEPVRLPTQEEVNELLQGQAIEGIVIGIVSEGGLVAHYIDGLPLHESIGLIEDIKWGLIAEARAINVTVEE